MSRLSNHTSRRKLLRENNPADLSFFSVKEAPHFYGFDIEEAITKNLDQIPIDREENIDFHCEIQFAQIDDTFDCTYRLVAARLKDGHIVQFDTDGVPSEREQEFRDKCKIAYHLIYPNGLTLEMMRK